MSETPQQYTQRMLAQTNGQKPLKVQAATAKKIKALIKGKPAAKLRKRDRKSTRLNSSHRR